MSVATPARPKTGASVSVPSVRPAMPLQIYISGKLSFDDRRARHFECDRQDVT